MKIGSTPGEDFDKTLAPNGRLTCVARWLPRDRADRLFECLRNDIDWQSRTIRMFGRKVVQPRLLAFQGDPGVCYRYSGGDYEALPWHPAIELIRNRLQIELATVFNSVLVNLYRDGRDCMGWHSDNERELGRNPTIASVSLGQRRRFLLRSRTEPARTIELEPDSGSLLVMAGDLQHAWKHQVPRTARTVGPRINLTFRRIQPSVASGPCG